MFDFIKNIGFTEFLLIVLILTVLFGGKSIAKRLARASGQTVKEVKEVKREFTKAIEGDDNESVKKSSKK